MKVKTYLGFLLLGSVAAAPARGQGKQPGPRPRAALVRDIEQIFMNQVSREMALTEEQAPRFQHVESIWAQKRAALEAEERQLRQALSGELRPGVAANADSVSRLVDALGNNRVAYAESFRDEMRELTPILNPVQRGQFQVARDRLLQKVRDLQLQRAGGLLAPSGGP